MLGRRDFITRAATLATLCSLFSLDARGKSERAKAPSPLRILILGGTGFIGPHYIRAALDRGHQVSIFNRGTHLGAVPPAVERLIGDRNGNLEAIKNRDWDVVLDLATYTPSWVRSMGEAIGHRTRIYHFISTNAVYPLPTGGRIMDEKATVIAYSGTEDPYKLAGPTDLQSYGALKVLCEREATKRFDRVLISRPGYIVGPGDPQHYLTYWLARFALGGNILVAGSRSTPVQFIDVRDLADWSIRAMEDELVGAYNAVGPDPAMNLAELLSVVQRVSGAPARVTWVPDTWLASRPDQASWNMILFWTDQGRADSMHVSNARALGAGLKLRKVDSTLRDTLSWFQDRSPKEKEVLVGGSAWGEYLSREREVLAAWSSERGIKDG